MEKWNSWLIIGCWREQRARYYKGETQWEKWCLQSYMTRPPKHQSHEKHYLYKVRYMYEDIWKYYLQNAKVITATSRTRNTPVAPTTIARLTWVMDIFDFMEGNNDNDDIGKHTKSIKTFSISSLWRRMIFVTFTMALSFSSSSLIGLTRMLSQFLCQTTCELL